MRQLLHLLVSVVIALSFAASAAAGPALLTITGNVEETNREASNAFYDGFFNYHDKGFEKAFAFDAEALSALPQHSVTVNADVEDWPGAVSMRGPRLADLLAAAGAEGKALSLYALDGFAIQLTPEEVAARDWILAIEADGKPLGIGGMGPAWLVYDTGDRKATEAEEKKWIWSIFLIEAE